MTDYRTIKTAIGYVFTRIDKSLPVSLRSESLNSIYNYLLVDDRFHTSGQPTAKQLKTITKSGFKTVINLAPGSAENAIKEEREILEKAGLRYLHIPVNFVAPAESDYQIFCKEMFSLKPAETWIHCAANMRVSAFMFRYQCEHLNREIGSAKEDLGEIWQPFRAWKKFVRKVNQYQ